MKYVLCVQNSAPSNDEAALAPVVNSKQGQLVESCLVHTTLAFTFALYPQKLQSR